jgi:hypothetical protein
MAPSGAQACILGLCVDGKKLIHLGHDPDGDLIFGTEFNRIEELWSGMRPSIQRGR